MTSPVLKLLKLFSSTHTTVRQTESHRTFEGTYKSTVRVTRVPAIQDLKTALAEFPERDKISLSISVSGADATAFASAAPEQLEAQLAALQQPLAVADMDNECVFTLTIVKEIVGGELTLYSPSLFLTHLQSGTIADRLTIFNTLINETGSGTVFCQETIAQFGSRTIQFINQNSAYIASEAPDRVSILAKRDDIAHFVNAANYELIPDDFKLVEPGASVEWQQIFEQLTNVLVVACTADHTHLEAADKLSFKLNGYKLLAGTLNPEDLVGDRWVAAFKIYEWTYQGGSASDKAGLLRNILSLNLDKGMLCYGNDVFSSVRSGFEIYLKRNVQQYIEVKTKLSDYLQNLSQEALGNVERYTGALKETLGALMTFFISTMILSAIGGRGLSGIFTTDITYLTFAFVVGSVLYLSLSLYFLRRKRLSLEREYASFKLRYSDLLDAKDLERIFEGDKPVTKISAEMKAHAKWISVVWILVTLILGTVAFVLYHKQASLGTSKETKSGSSPQPPADSP